MKLSTPKNITFVIALILALVGLFAALGILSFIPAAWGLWLLFIGFVLLALGVLLKGL
jgi:predicted membrane channel-forming protein YqfA (hemolysin III family)